MQSSESSAPVHLDSEVRVGSLPEAVSFGVPHVPFQYPTDFNFSEESITIRAPILPLLDHSHLSAQQTALAEKVQKQYLEAEAGARDLLRILHNHWIRIMRNSWTQWHMLPLLLDDSKTSSFPQLESSPIVQTEVTRAQVDALRVELRELNARLAATGTNSASNPPPPLSPPTAVASPVDYATCMALSAARRDLAHMKVVFDRHKDVEGGLSKTALVAALKEVDAPVLSSSEGASEDSLFRRADTNLSGSVDQNECALLPAFPHTRHSCSNAMMRRFMLVANLPDDLEMFLADHNLSVSAAAAFPPQRTCHSILLCSLLHRRSELMHPVELTSWAA